jgi:hypothetical protein
MCQIGPWADFQSKARFASGTRQREAISRRPRHLAAALLDRAGDIGVDDARHLEDVVRFIDRALPTRGGDTRRA